MENLTKEQIEKHINAALVSVSLVEKLNTMLEFTDDELDMKTRNIDHLKIMMSKEWFVKGLTKTQKETIENIIK